MVDEHGLCAANVAACRAFDKLTPSISNGICPVDTRAIQPVGFPFPLPILTSVGFPVIGRSARTLTHILLFLRLIARWNCPIVARRAASMARYERRPALQLLVPYLPKPSCVPSGLQPLLHLPLRYLIYLVRFGYSTSPFFYSMKSTL
nr:ribosomal protein L16 [Spiraea chinensis]WON65743.1 ribosomal protein L16 [Spiraea japonica]WON65769.1 ribosomal protein L16 [Spiraea nipponica]